MVILVSDNQSVETVQTDAGRPVELTRPRALRPELAVVAPVTVENTNSVVASVCHHNQS